MTIEKDISELLEKGGERFSVENAYSIVRRFDQIAEEIEEDSELLPALQYIGAVPPSMRKIISSYISQEVSKDQAIHHIKELKTRAVDLFEQAGFCVEKVQNYQPKTLEQTIDESERLLLKINGIEPSFLNAPETKKETPVVSYVLE